jgi:hypothetical protein
MSPYRVVSAELLPNISAGWPVLELEHRRLLLHASILIPIYNVTFEVPAFKIDKELKINRM